MPNSTSDRRGNRKPFTREQYDRMLHYFRARPGDVAGAAKEAGVSVRTAEKTWRGPPRPLYPWAEPIEEVLRREESDRLAAAAAEEARLLIVAEKARKEEHALETERRRVDRDVLRLARADVLNGLSSIAKMTPAIDTLVTRTVDFVKRGVDAKGNPVEVNLQDLMLIMNRYSSAVARLADAASSIAAVEEVRKALPPAPTLVQVNIGGPGGVSLDDAQRELAEAQEALARAQRLEVLGRGVEVEGDTTEEDGA